MIYRLVIFCLLFSLYGCQRSMDGFIDRWSDQTVPFIDPLQLDSLDRAGSMTLVDIRAWEEYAVSHLAKADWGGYKEFDAQAFERHHPDKSQPVVLYCTLGVRSERIGEQLIELGYDRVYNLYGGIIEWKNQGMPVQNLSNKPTDSVHTYSKRYSRWLLTGIPTYD